MYICYILFFDFVLLPLNSAGFHKWAELMGTLFN